MPDAPRMEVLRVRDLSRAERDALARDAHTPFQTPAYADAFDAAGGTALVARAADRAGEPNGHALLLEETLLGFNTWLGLGHPYVPDRDDAEAFSRALLRAAATRGVVSAAWRDLSTTRLDAAALAALRRATARRGGTTTHAPFVTHTLDLTAPHDALWTELHRKHRNAIRRAESDGATLTRPTDRAAFAKTFTTLSDDTWARSGRAGPAAAYYERLLHADWTLPYLATDTTGTPTAAAIVTLWKGHATYLHGASVADTGGASTLLQWHAMQDLQRRGATTYDLGGSPLARTPNDNERTAGIRRFKERLGGDARTWNVCHVKVHPRYYSKARGLLLSRARTGAGG